MYIDEKVLERRAITNNYIERQPNGKMRVTSGSWDGQKVFLVRSGVRGAERPRPDDRQVHHRH